MVDAQLLKSCDLNGHAGSIPALGTIRGDRKHIKR